MREDSVRWNGGAEVFDQAEFVVVIDLEKTHWFENTGLFVD